MLSAERKNLILERLEAEGSVLVAPLSVEFGVSEETIRRDLEKLEREGLASRSYGGASFTGGQRELPYSVRKRFNVAGKRKIAAAIAARIPDGAYIMLDESSTSAFVAQALREKKNITLITNSIETVITIADIDGWNVQLTGGMLKSGALSLTGHRAEKVFSEYHVDFAVISCKGLDMAAGFTDAMEDNAILKRAIIRSADCVILAADSRKFDKRAFASIGKLNEIAMLVTDAEPNALWKVALRDAGVELIYES